MLCNQSSLLDLVDEENSDGEEAPTLLQHSQYYTTDQLCELLAVEPNHFRILSLNCQSLNAKFNQLRIYLEGCSLNFSVICLQETWLSDISDVSMLQLPGYNFISKGKLASNHGGVAIYLKDTFSYEILPISSASNSWDSLFIEVSLNESVSSHSNKSVVIGNIYRPPRDTVENYTSFTSEMDQIFHNFKSCKNKDIVIAGDFNIDLLKIKDKPSFNDYFETVISNGFLPKITLPTRKTSHSSTLIDNILVRPANIVSSANAGILKINISDHFPCFLSLDSLKIDKCSHKFIKIWSRDKFSLNRFYNELNKECTAEKFDSNLSIDPNLNYEILNNIIQNAYEKHIPVKFVRFNKHKHKLNNWITRGIISSIKFRDRLYKRLTDTPSNTPLYHTLKINLSTYNKILKRLIREAKRNYYQSCFKKFQRDIKKTWNMINSVLNKNHHNGAEFPKFFCVNNTYIADRKQIADCFNRYFTNIGSELADRIDTPPNKSYKDFLRKPTKKRFTFQVVTSEIVSKVIDDMKPKSSSGYDRISNNLLKFIKNAILGPLTLLINQSICCGMFPDKFKIAKVIPLFKKNENYLLENYRPISVLPSMSKVLERIMHSQLSAYFSEHKLLYDHQYGFRKSHSTEYAALEFIDRVISCMDRNGTPLSIFIDLSKAFDTIDHKILLFKLRYYGITGKSFSLIENYLTNRQQYTFFDDTRSSFSSIKTGVPQGSILGPLFFIIYVNDLRMALKNFHPVMYADDTTLSASLRAFDCTGQDRDSRINAELQNLSKWLKLNKLSLNADKTKAMLFHTIQKTVTLPKINIDGSDIEFVDAFDYLGIVIDKNLSWNDHIARVSLKVSKVLGVMSRMKNILPKEVLLILYNSLFLPYISYGILSWKSKITNLETLQKKAVRIVAGAKYNAHSVPILKTLRLLKIFDLCTLCEYKFCFKFENKMLPTYFQTGLFVRNSEIHDHDTRTINDLNTPQIKHEFAKYSIRFIIPEALNSCPKDIRNKIPTHSLDGFVKYIKRYFLDRYIHDCTIRNCPSC